MSAPSIIILQQYEDCENRNKQAFDITFDFSIKDLSAYLGYQIASKCTESDITNCYESGKCDIATIMQVMSRLRQGGCQLLSSNAYLDNRRNVVVRTFYFEQSAELAAESGYTASSTDQDPLTSFLSTANKSKPTNTAVVHQEMDYSGPLRAPFESSNLKKPRFDDDDDDPNVLILLSKSHISPKSPSPSGSFASTQSTPIVNASTKSSASNISSTSTLASSSKSSVSRVESVRVEVQTQSLASDPLAPPLPLKPQPARQSPAIPPTPATPVAPTISTSIETEESFSKTITTTTTNQSISNTTSSTNTMISHTIATTSNSIYTRQPLTEVVAEPQIDNDPLTEQSEDNQVVVEANLSNDISDMFSSQGSSSNSSNDSSMHYMSPPPTKETRNTAGMFSGKKDDVTSINSATHEQLKTEHYSRLGGVYVNRSPLLAGGRGRGRGGLSAVKPPPSSDGSS